MSYEKMIVIVATAAMLAYPFVQAWVWWPTIKTFCNDEELEYRYPATRFWSARHQTIEMSLLRFTLMYLAVAIVAAFAWIAAFVVAVVFGGMWLKQGEQ